MTNNQNLTYRFNNGVPNQLTESISPWLNKSRTGWDAVFVQERWTRGRLTVQGAVRFDRARSWFPAQQEGPSRFLPVPIIIPETAGVDSYKDITPRLGVAYDVFGDGRTALKVHLGRYLDGAGTSGIYLNTNPTLRMPQTTSRFGTAGVTRAWSDANGNFVPDCDLLNPGAQDLRASGGDLCGVVSNTKLRAECADQQLRSGDSQRLGRPAIGLDARRLGAAADSSPGIGDALLQPSLVPWLYRCRQPGVAAVRSDTLQRRGPSRSPPAGRRRLRGVGPVRRRP